MARIHAASASLRAPRIRGIAKWLARPAYRRLLSAEPILRRAVPVLILLFIATVGVGALVQVSDSRSRALKLAGDQIQIIAAALRNDIAARGGITSGSADVLDRALPTSALANGRIAFVSDAAGRVAAAWPERRAGQGEMLADLVGSGRSLLVALDRGSASEITLADGRRALAAVRALGDVGGGHVAVVQLVDDVLAAWRTDATLSITLFSTSGGILLILGFAFHWQSTRAREADAIYETVRQRVDTALARGRCGLWDWDLARGRIYWSDSMYEILGLVPRDDILSFGEIAELVHPDDGDLYDLAAHLADSSLGSVDRVFRMRHVCGEWLWLRVRCDAVRRTTEPGPHLVGIAVDITEQKRMAAASEEADARLRDAIEEVSAAFALWDADKRLVLCNSQYQALHGLPDTHIRAGIRLDDVVAASRDAVIRTHIEDCTHPGSRTFEAELDDSRWFQVTERMTKDGGFVSVGTDITSRKRHEEKLVDSERRLLATVTDLRKSQHKLELQAQQLADLAQKYAEEKTRAEDANRAKSEFLANMSHELRTPLNAIIGFSEIMENGMFGKLGSPKYFEYCQDIRVSGQHLLDVIDDILDMSKIEAGRMDVELADVRLDDVVAETMRIMAVRAAEKGLAVGADVRQPIVLRADRRAVKQIMLNLLSNAVKFTPEGGRITVRARAANGFALMAIEDSGIGIPTHALANLGRPFEQVQSQFTKNHKGTGLGLAIAMSLADLQGGAIKIRSTEGVGTRALVRLPLAEARAAAA